MKQKSVIIKQIFSMKNINKVCYFKYREYDIIKGIIKNKVFRLEPKGIGLDYYGEIHKSDLHKLFYRYYYVIEVDSICNLLSDEGKKVREIKETIKHPINIVEPIEEVYETIDDLMLNNQEVEYISINVEWFEKALKDNNVPSNGFALDKNLNIVRVDKVNNYIKFVPIPINISTPFTDRRIEAIYYGEKYDIITMYSDHKGGGYTYKDVYPNITDAIEEKKKHFEISNNITFNHTICNYYNDIDFKVIKEDLIKKLN